MAKFDLKAAKAAEQKKGGTMPAGFRRTAITQVVEVGLQRAFDPQDPPKESLGIVFEDEEGNQVAKIVTTSLGPYANLGKILGAIDEVDELDEMLGQQLDLEIEANGQWPKVLGYYPTEDGMSGGAEITNHSDPIYYSVESPNPEVMKTLHPQIRSAIAGRVRVKE